MNEKVQTQEFVAKSKLVLRQQAIPASILLSVMLALYVLSLYVSPGWMTFGISSLSLVIVLVTVLARVNDMSIGLTGGRWNFRRAGLTLAGAGAFADMLSNCPAWGNAPTWNEAMLHAGFAMTWLTTPNMPPWWSWIAGKVEVKNDRF